jgi:hypothetical protein
MGLGYNQGSISSRGARSPGKGLPFPGVLSRVTERPQGMVGPRGGLGEILAIGFLDTTLSHPMVETSRTKTLQCSVSTIEASTFIGK